MISKDIDLNFNINPLTGDLNRKTNSDAVKQSLRTLLLLGLFEKPFNSDLNVNIRGFLFENYLINADKELQKNIRRIITKYEPRITLKNVIVSATPDQNAIDITIEYYYTGNKEETLSFSLERTR
jgi:phage baseplate assembly protein W